MATDGSRAAPHREAEGQEHPPSMRGTLVDSIVDEELPVRGDGIGRLEPGATLGRFTVIRLLGAGGMGEVFLCHDPDLERDVAVKLLHARESASGGDAMRERLLREARAIAKLAHPNVISVHDVAVWNDRVFLAMEFVPGVTLGRWVSALATDWRAIVAMFIQAGRGLIAAHRAGMIHRDFKPDNVLVGDDGRARVLDFGIARATTSEIDDRVTDRWDILGEEDDSLSRPIQRHGVLSTGVLTKREPSASPDPVDGASAAEREGEVASTREPRGTPLEHGLGIEATHAVTPSPYQARGLSRGAAEDLDETRAAPEGLTRAPAGIATADRSVFTRPRDTSTRLTSTGMLIGTPAYMAPEQFAGGPLDARADQFSFCVALWESLYNQRPYLGNTMASLSAVVLRGEITPPPTGSKIPARVEALLRKGLSVRREDRHEDLEALLEQLESILRPQERRRWGAIAVFAIASTLAVSAYAMRDTEDHDAAATQACAGDASLLGQSWDDAARLAARERFVSLDPARGEQTWQRTEQRAQHWLESWFEARTAACRDSHELHRQSGETLELRLACLDGLGAEFKARAQLWQDADAQIMGKAIESAASMSPPSLCSDVQRLQEHSAALKDPSSQASRYLAEDLPSVRAQMSAGLYKAAADQTEGIWRSANERKDLPAIVVIGLDRGRALEKSGRPLDSRTVLTTALRSALTLGMDEEATLAAAYLGSTSGVSLSMYDEGEAYLGVAAALAARRPTVDARSHQVARSHCHFLNDRGRIDEALGYCNQAVEESIAVFGEDSLEYAGNLHNLANNFIMRRDQATAREFLERAVVIVTGALGDRHPRVAGMLSSLSAMEYYAGNTERAREHCARAVDIIESGSESIGGEALVCKISLATIAMTLDELDEALRLVTEVESLSRTVKGEVSSERVFVENIRGSVAASRGDWKLAREHYEKALDFALRTRAADHPDVLETAMFLAEADLALGEPKEVPARLDVIDKVLAAQPNPFGSSKRALIEARHWLALGELAKADEQLAAAQTMLAESDAVEDADYLVAYIDLYRARAMRMRDPSSAQAATLEASGRDIMTKAEVDGRRTLAVYDAGR